MVSVISRLLEGSRSYPPSQRSMNPGDTWHQINIIIPKAESGDVGTRRYQPCSNEDQMWRGDERGQKPKR